ncbi:MAG: hemolysin family protein [Candidatus Methanomethylophilaceae archaeon]|nr:hemolysin family protein [Candidatus Methanomethylophilaceae archaeon]MDY5873120.1 hemolysin family protein [Candidatus Methanomethylophilaceae archaeon]
MDATFYLSIAGLAILVILSGMFSATETSFTSASKIKLKKMEEEGNAKATRTISLLEQYDKLLTTILVGNNLVNIMSSSLCTLIFTESFGSVGVMYATVFMLVVILTVGEITPKVLAKSRPEKFALLFTPMMLFVSKVFAPITWIFQKVSTSVTEAVNDGDETPTLTEEELMIMVDEIEEEGELEETERDLIKSAIRFDDKTVAEILTPRVDILGVDRNATMEDVKSLFIHSGFSRLPVYEDTVDKIIGVVYSKDFFARYFMSNRDERIDSIIRRVRCIPESTSVATALSEIQKSTVQMLVVIDDYGGTVGIVSLEDVLEELVGEIWDESDEIEYDVVKDADGTFIAKGDANINNLMEEIERRFDLEDYDGSTIGGFIQYKLNRSPIIGDRISVESLDFTVTSVRNRRIKFVKINVRDPEGTDPEDNP